VELVTWAGPTAQSDPQHSLAVPNGLPEICRSLRVQAHSC